jgi:hypothetical protein
MHGVSLGVVDEKNDLKFCLFSITSKNARALQREEKKLSNVNSKQG